MNILRFVEEFPTEDSCREHFRTGLRNGSMMEYSKLPLRTWYLTMAFMSFSKKGISAAEMQRQLGHRRYDTVRSLMHDSTIKQSIDETRIVFSDRASSYVNIADHVQMHVTEVSSKQTTGTTLNWAHIAISNAKRTLLGIYHKIKGKYLQLYLDEFCYKLNRRYFGDRLFDRPVIAVARSYW